MTKATTTKRAPNQTSWKPGISGNAKGRPRTGLAFSERIRERLDPDVVITLLLRHLADEDVPIAARLASALPYIGAGYAKPATATDLTINGSTPTRDFSAMSLDERRELLGRLRAVPAIGATSDTQATEPGPPDPRPSEPRASDDK